jgi:hypothetical protein
MINSLLSEMFTRILDEASTATSALRGSPYADQLIRSMHKALAIPHDMLWDSVDKISWNDVKQRSPNFVLITGTTGTAAVRWDGYFQAFVSYNEGVTKHAEDSVGALMPYIKAGIGKTTGFWEARNSGKTKWGRRSTYKTGDVEQLRKNRADTRNITTTSIFDPKANYDQNFHALMRKLKPLYMRYIEQAIADIKGAAAIAIKNDAFERGIAKLGTARGLQELYQTLLDDPNPESMPDRIENGLLNAIRMTAAYYYPEQTGEIMRVRPYYGGAAANPKGERQVIADVANGDQEKMVTIMQFFKQDLLHK